MHFTKTHIYFWALIKQTEYIVMISKEVYQILKRFLCYSVGIHVGPIGHVEKMHYFF